MQIIGFADFYVIHLQQVVESEHVEAGKAKERGLALMYIGQTGEERMTWCVQIVTPNQWIDVKCVFELM